MGASKKQLNQIRVLITGGTIDDISLGKSATPGKSSYIPMLLEQARLSPKIKIKTEVLMQKDSRQITQKDRELILERCRNCDEKMILITHGTYTLPETARYLGSKVKNKTIALTGSEIPFPKPKSDAMFNIGDALRAVRMLSPGVYVVMNGEVFQWNNVQKDLATRQFRKKK